MKPTPFRWEDDIGQQTALGARLEEDGTQRREEDGTVRKKEDQDS